MQTYISNIQDRIHKTVEKDAYSVAIVEDLLQGTKQWSNI